MSTAAKVQAYEAAKAQAAIEAPTSPVVWLVATALVVAFGGGVAVGWWATTAAIKK